MEGKDLVTVLQKHPETTGDLRQLTGILRDYFPKERREIWLLERALDIGILRELQANQINKPLLLKLSKRLTDEFFLQENWAIWAVSMWAYAYGSGVLGKTMPRQKEEQPVQSQAESTPQPFAKQTPLSALGATRQQAKEPTVDPAQAVQKIQQTQQTHPVQQAVPSPAAQAPLPSDFRLDSSGKIVLRYIGSGGDVVIPDGITEIGDRAFNVSSAVISVTVPKGVVWLGNSAFSSCSSLRNVTISQGVIGEFCFSGCSSLQNVTLLPGVTEIGKYAFSSCSRLQTMVIPQGVTSIGEEAFSYCSRLQNVSIPKSLSYIGRFAFYDCSCLERVTIQQGLTEIRGAAFSGCHGLREITIPPGVARIDGSAFASCTSLQRVMFPGSVRYMEDDAFWMCDKNILTLYAPAGSYVQDYARTYGLRFCAI